MRRRTFIVGLGSAAAAWPLTAQAQQPVKVWRIGFLASVPAAAYAHRFEKLRQGLRELGYAEGANLVIESRWADNNNDRLPALAAELVHSNMDVIVTSGTPSALAAKQATATVPVVMAVIGDPVAAGVVANLARPSGNITGQSFFAPEITPKRLEALKEILPQMSQVAYLTNLQNPIERSNLRIMETAAQSLNIALEPVSVRGPHEFARAFELIGQRRIPAIVMSEDAIVVSNNAQLAALALSWRLLSAGNPEAAHEGAAIGFGVDNVEMYRTAAVFIDKIFKGAKPADLPIQQATKFQFVLNLKTAKALGLTIPETLLATADEVIQ
jgi:putative ABC transport system substrate-binding protein